MLANALIAGILLLLNESCFGKRKWDYELISAFSNTTDETKVKFDVRTHRVSRDVIVLSGVYTWLMDIDNTTTAEAIFQSCYSGIDSEYVALPYELPKTDYYDFLDTFYNQMYYSNFKHCSNVPMFKNRYETPFNNFTTKYNKCIPTAEGMPDILPQAYYRLIWKIQNSQGVEIITIITMKVTLKIL